MEVMYTVGRRDRRFQSEYFCSDTLSVQYINAIFKLYSVLSCSLIYNHLQPLGRFTHGAINTRLHDVDWPAEEIGWLPLFKRVHNVGSSMSLL
jgi:hypothetical protein